MEEALLRFFIILQNTFSSDIQTTFILVSSCKLEFNIHKNIINEMEYQISLLGIHY